MERYVRSPDEARRLALPLRGGWYVGRQVTRILGKFQNDKLIQVRGATLHIFSSTQLAELCASHNVYLHSTPVPELFARARRDFSHGCTRVEKPDELAAWVLLDQPGWSLDSVRATMQSGPDNRQVNLTRPIPVVIVYLTSVVEENGEVFFFPDIYGLDHQLNLQLAKVTP